MQQGNRHCTANIRNTRAHSSRRWRISASEIASLPFRSGGLAAAGSRKGIESVLAL